MDKFEAFAISSNIARNRGMTMGQQWALQAMMSDHDKKSSDRRRPARSGPKRKKTRFF